MARSKPLAFWIDMNAVHDDTVGALLTHALDPIAAQLDPPHRGDLVLTVDEEENRCVATVVDVNGLWIGLRLDWDTWMPGLDLELVTAVRRSAPKAHWEIADDAATYSPSMKTFIPLTA